MPADYPSKIMTFDNIGAYNAQQYVDMVNDCLISKKWMKPMLK